MGLWDRLRGKEEKSRAMRVAVIGANVDARHLLQAYNEHGGFEAASVCAQSAQELARNHEVAALEICLPIGEAQELALAGLRAGLFVSTTCPLDRPMLAQLEAAAAENLGILRIRQLPLYYPPYLEIKRLLEDDAIGRPTMLKITSRHGRGTVLPEPFDPADWVRRHEVGFLALAVWLLGPAVRASGRLSAVRIEAGPASLVIGWKFDGPHLYGYMQVDFCPGLHVRTLTEPVHRAIEITGIGGHIFATRGEGQLMRQPPLIIRGKSTATSFELLNDDWREVYRGLARESASVLKEAQPIRVTSAIAEEALKIIEMAER